jgi:hypothetical protein
VRNARCRVLKSASRSDGKHFAWRRQFRCPAAYNGKLVWWKIAGKARSRRNYANRSEECSGATAWPRARAAAPHRRALGHITREVSERCCRSRMTGCPLRRCTDKLTKPRRWGQAERIAEVDRVPARKPIQVQPAGEADRVFLRERDRLAPSR